MWVNISRWVWFPLAKRHLEPRVLHSMTRNIQDTETISVSVQRCTDKKTRKIHTMEYYSAIETKSCQFYATEMDLEGIMLTEVSQTERQTQILYDLIYKWNLKRLTKTKKSEMAVIKGSVCPERLSRVRLFVTPWTVAPPGSSAHRLLQARILEWDAIPFSRRSCQQRDKTHVSCIPGRFFPVWAIREALWSLILSCNDAIQVL